MACFSDPKSNSEAMLQVVHGYYELGMNEDAWNEFREVEKKFPATPAIIQMKLLLLIKDEEWDDALSISEELRCMEPQNGAGFIHGAYCLHELSRTGDALDLLEKAPESVRREAIYHYNKGCYQAAIGDIETARSCLQKSFDLDKSLVEVARKAPDLVALQGVL